MNARTHRTDERCKCVLSFCRLVGHTHLYAISAFSCCHTQHNAMQWVSLDFFLSVLCFFSFVFFVSVESVHLHSFVCFLCFAECFIIAALYGRSVVECGASKCNAHISVPFCATHAQLNFDLLDAMHRSQKCQTNYNLNVLNDRHARKNETFIHWWKIRSAKIALIESTRTFWIQEKFS